MNTRPRRVTDAQREAFLESFPRLVLNTTPGDAMLLRILVESTRASRGLEVGSATGYGAIQMGIAFEGNGGRLTTLESDPARAGECRRNLAAMDLEETVKLLEGDALRLLPSLEGPFDFVFIDALKREYLAYFQMIESKLTPGAVLVADNVIQYAAEMSDFLDVIQHSPDYHVVVIRASLEKNDGMAVCYRKR
jgi:caffeoyl-CoA O-methyltransferase